MSSLTAPTLNPFTKAMMPGAQELIDQHKCPFCKKDITPGGFRDGLSAREYEISGMCQECQDHVFEGGDDE